MAPSTPILTAVAASRSPTDFKDQITLWLARIGEAITSFFMGIGEAIGDFFKGLIDHFVNGLLRFGQRLLEGIAGAGLWLLWLVQWTLILVIGTLALSSILTIVFKLSMGYLTHRYLVHRERGLLNRHFHTASAPRYQTFRPAREGRRHDAARTTFSATFTWPRSTPASPDEAAHAKQRQQSRDESAGARWAAGMEWEARDRVGREEAARAAQRRLREEEQRRAQEERKRCLEMGKWLEMMSRVTGQQIEKLSCIPDPPGAYSVCHDGGCRAPESTRRVLGFCKHSLADMRNAYEKLNGKEKTGLLLKEVTKKWHPNRSRIVRSNEMVRKQAAELTAILHGLSR